MKVLVLHGPNLNLLGEREPEVYGTLTLDQIDQRILDHAASLNVEVRTARSNVEGELVTLIQDARSWAAGIVLNPGGYAHTSVAIRDAVAAIDVPVIEVHLSNPSAREEFRHTDLVGGACAGVISGFGWRSYALALDALSGLGNEADSGSGPGRPRK
ncbi:MAG TPA: type II 3-dehydroquinate dehydratase [Actinomycetota bacterium]|jgi:3-dehydroquinate dehydratase-2